MTLYLSRAEAERRAALAGLGPCLVRGAIDRGELPAYRLGRAVKIKADDFDQWLAAPGRPASEPDWSNYRCKVM